jgi:hypothetical protein
MRLYTKMGDNTKQVRVDNWGIFFLQRLQMFFSKTDYCDMTLQFEGNVQLKVHRLVMNACTEYFQFLEQTCTLEENVIMMPSDLQADVIVPIVNFMYTGMLEFHLSIFDRLYKTAQVMNITILTKLLDAQKQPLSPAVKPVKKKHIDSPHFYNLQAKKTVAKTGHHSDLPAPLPGRKLPVWKRKSIPTPSQSHSHSVSQLCFPEPRWAPAVDPLSLPDNTPKPTRFEWPDEDLPALNLMDTSFEEISYTSKPLLTQEEEHRASTSFDDLKHIPNANRSIVSSKKRSSPTLDMEEMKNYVKEQKIRSGLSQDDEGADNEVEIVENSQKRKAPDQKVKGVTKKVRFDEQENKTTTISIATDAKSGGELNHEKIVTEILKKYPQLVKKNKNIRLKIMAKNKTAALEPTKVENIQIRTPRVKVQVAEVSKPEPSKTALKSKDVDSKTDNKAPWTCDRCSTEDESVEFVLYYLYRKHMTDVHNEKFDPKLCKYCGHRCNKHNLLMYHLYTKHGMKPPPDYNFPKCDQCPFIALSSTILGKHKLRHGKNEIQCSECKLAFTSQATLTSHVQITGHTGKSTKNNYDCQYCTKRYQSGVNLFSHVRLQHRNEAMRDGIVSIDEADDAEDYDDEETVKDEYILPEIITDPEPPPSKKVNILSNVKVQDRQEHHIRHQELALEPSSEAEALNNVATGIATSLGLVDIVVLNDNQQLFLQPNQQNFSNDQSEQPEFILPELTGRESYTQNQNEVITTEGVITQSMLSSGDIASTDELVMVLTDHDYGDNQEEVHNDNSNIVVLYSHPVDGQQDQYITSQGNIMVNSQTGMIEIRNGATITSTANQVVMNPQESHIESIEMIQREIESHGELKQESLYDEDTKPALDVTEKEQSQTELKEAEPEVTSESQSQNDLLIDSLTQGEQLEFTTPLEPVEVPPTVQTPVEETPTENQEEQSKEANDEKEIIDITSEETNDKNEEIAAEREEGGPPVEKEDPSEENREGVEVSTVEEKEPVPVDTGGQEEVGEVRQEDVEVCREDGEVRQEDGAVRQDDGVVVRQEDGESVFQEDGSESVHQEVGEEPSESINEEVGESTLIEENESAPPVEEVKKEEKVETPPSPQAPVEETEKEPLSGDDSSKTDLMEISEDRTKECLEEEKNQEETNAEQESSQSDTSTSQFNDENSQSSQESQNKPQETVSTKISILDDWEDTDSQQSDQKEKAKAAGEAVHKLMDDWEEEEEDECRKEGD